MASQSLVSVLPAHSASDLCSLQRDDPFLKEVLVFWQRNAPPTSGERQQLSKPVMALLRQWDRLVEKDGVLFRQVFRSDGGEESLQLLLPVALKQDTLNQLHQEHGHQGIERTTELVRQRCYWPGMSSDIKSWVQQCERCQVAKDSGRVPHSFMGHLLASRPNEILAIDFTLLEPSRSGFENVLVMTDVFSKFTVAVPTRDQRASTVAQVLFCYNTTPHQSTGESPFYLMFGQEPRLPVDFLLGRVQDPTPGMVQDWVVEHQARLQVAFEGAHERLRVAAGRRKERHDQQDTKSRISGVLWSTRLSRHHLVKEQCTCVAPVNDLQKVRNVHRDMLKAVIQSEAKTLPSKVPSPPTVAALDDGDSYSDSDVWLLVPETPVPQSTAPTGILQPSGPLVVPLQTGSVPETPRPHGPSSPPAPLQSPADQPSTSQQALRRTARSTAGHHSNVHHLPRSIGPQNSTADEPSDPASYAHFAVFRPWC
ncbi:hypothetical protein L3Q82_009626 [Scortum barcoo]|uniref:Uncharacterized protein n=1 Tax=Scortum barcoo TaxID=214431 RepID=A0ACB8WGK9_9TELE|nr:hypothetical protein L3Q82_009626 [Scortum barcoo]